MKTVTITCKGCSNTFTVKYKLRKQKYCSRGCVNNSFSGSGNPSYGKTYRTKDKNPEWAEKISKTSTDREINKGDKNGMKNPEVAKRQGRTRSYKFATDPLWSKRTSAYVRKAWADGKFDEVPVGRRKWYSHIKPDGTEVKLQGTWEVIFARHMDKLGIDYESHQGTIKYSCDGIERSYLPDFYVPSINTHVDVKGAFFDSLQQEKFSKIKSSNPEIRIYLVTKEEFLSMGIDVLKEAKSVSKKPKG
jgi:hypothetical protein